MPVHDIIVIGASAGGVEALRLLVGALPAGLPAALFIVVHFPPDSVSMLPAILSRYGPLPVCTAEDNAPIVSGRIYVASPDFHLLIRDEVMRLYRGPRENHTRPAIDPLFRSAAQSYGTRVIGVLLSGMLNDGTAGLIEIKRQGGLVIVQDPKDALFPDMPLSAVKNVNVDYVLPLALIAPALIGLVTGEHAHNPDSPQSQKASERIAQHTPVTADSVSHSNEENSEENSMEENSKKGSSFEENSNGGNVAMSDDRFRTEHVQSSAADQDALSDAEYTPGQDHANKVVAVTNQAQILGQRNGQPSTYSCPDCGGVLWQMNEQEFLRFRCHVGHAHSAESLLKQQMEVLESSMWYAVRTLADRANLSRQMAEKATERGHHTSAERFSVQAQVAEGHASVIRRLIENDLSAQQTQALSAVEEEDNMG